MDWKLELVAVPVSDVDRAKAFYTDQAGFNADHDHTVSDEMRFVQLTPPGSSVLDRDREGDRGRRTRVGPGPADDRHRRRRRRTASSSQRGVEVSDVEHLPWGSFVFFNDPDGNTWAVQQIPPRG